MSSPAADNATSDDTPASADDIADIFSKLGDQIYEDCIFDLSEEQIEIQAALIRAYMDQGAQGAVARRLAAIQIQAPQLSPKCEQMRRQPPPPPVDWTTTMEAQEQAPEAPRVPPKLRSLQSPSSQPRLKCPCRSFRRLPLRSRASRDCRSGIAQTASTT